jgi:hypothetical protein
MDLMIVKDVMTGKNNQTILTGPLLMKGIYSRNEVKGAFGQQVFISSELGKRVCVSVNGVSVSQTIAGKFQVSIAVDYLDQESVALDSVVSNES